MRKKRGGGAKNVLQRSRWAHMEKLDTARRLNESSLELLLQISRNDNPSAHFVGVHDDTKLWARTDARAFSRAAGCPVLLMDLNFQRIEWWNRGVWGSPSAPAYGHHSSGFLVDQATPLVREILMEAWCLARTAPRAASLVFGMAPAVTTAIARLSASDIHRVVTTCTQHLRPRWEDRSGFWGNLLYTAIGTDDQALANMHLHCLQLLGSELLLHQG